MLQNATSLRKSAPGPPNISDKHVSCIAFATENASLQILFTCPTPAIVFGNASKTLRLPRESTSERPKVVRTPCAFNILTSKCASRHNGVHFFDISTSKSGPKLVCFVHFDFEMCSAPHRRAIFHLSSGQLAPHPRLWRAYFSTLRSHKLLEKRSVSRLSYLFAHLRLLSSEAFFFFFFSSLLFSSLTLTTSAFHLSILSEV